MRKIIISLAIIALLSSCATKSTEFGFSNMIPLKQVSLSSLTEDQYEFIGNVSGSAAISYEITTSLFQAGGISSKYDTYSYVGVLDFDNYRGIENAEIARAVDQALYAMTEKAYELGANMFILPTYRISTTEEGSIYKVDVTVSAVAIRLLDKNGEVLKSY